MDGIFTNMIKFNSVSMRYADGFEVEVCKLRTADGEMVFLTGHSGAGKSTLLKLSSQRPFRRSCLEV